MDWRIKGVVQKALGIVPGGTRVNDLLQKTLGELREVERTIDSKVVDDWVVLAGQLRELDVPLSGAELVEIGTGWMPVFPLCFALAGARACHTFDLQRHLSDSLTTRAVARLAAHLSRIAQVTGTSIAEVERRYGEIRQEKTLEGTLRRAGIRYYAPADASKTTLTDQSVDVVFSNSVLEHVPPEAIRGIFREARRVLRPTGLAIHSANCGDHYAYFDRSITFINYLQYSEREWRFWNNTMLYQNRLRPGDFLELARDAGFEILLSRWRPKEALLAALATLQLAPEFKAYPPEQLCATSVDFAARPSRTPGL
jgi:SAM-dependent methyltransferase